MQKLSLVSLTTVLMLLMSVCAFAETKSFTMYTVEIDGVKMWLPSTIVVKKGDKVEIKAIVKAKGTPPVHGFTIQDFKIVEVADDKGKTFTFTADKDGVFPIKCHLHPAHLGAQLVVLP